MSLRKLAATAVAIFVMGGAAATPSHASRVALDACAWADIQPQSDGDAFLAGLAITCLTNRERTARGLPPLKNSGSLYKAARLHSEDMVARDYFDHEAPQPGTQDPLYRARNAGYCSMSWCQIRENIRWGSGPASSARAALTSWMSSPYHRANILSAQMKELGVGAAYGSPISGDTSPRVAVYTQLFGAQG